MGQRRQTGRHRGRRAPAAAAGRQALAIGAQRRRGRHRGYLLVSPAKIVEHERVNIIQHPNGNPQKVVLTQNYVLADMSADRVHYLADTLPGSSGSPVLSGWLGWEPQLARRPAVL